MYSNIRNSILRQLLDVILSKQRKLLRLTEMQMQIESFR